MTRCLITGGSGFLGSHVADALSDRGDEVVLFDKVESRYQRPGMKMMVGDLTRPAHVRDAVAGADVIYHLGGFADLNAARTRPMDTVQANIVGTINLLEAVRDNPPKRFLFASTVYVYSRGGGFYRCSKQACENYIEEYARVWGMPYTILRYGSLYGPRSDAANGVWRLLNEAMHKGTVSYAGSPDDLREYIHVEDAARLSLQALDPEFENKHLFLAGNTALRASDLFTMFSEILGRPIEVRYRNETADGSGHYCVTPYTFTPKPGRKLSASHFVDMGQGLLQLCEELDFQQQAATR